MKKYRLHGKGNLSLRGKVWIARWRVDGKSYAKSTGCTDRREAEKVLSSLMLPFQTKNEIERLEVIKAKIATQESILSQEEYKQRRVKFEDIIETYFYRGFADDCTQTTKDSYEYTFKRLCDFVKEQNYLVEYLDDFDITMAEAYRKQISSLSNRTYNTIIRQLRSVWKNLKAKKNVWEDFKAKVVTSSARRALTFDETKKVLDFLRYGRKHEYNKDLYCLFLIGLYTGLRLGDCCYLKWSEVDFTRKIIKKVPHKTKKTEREVTVPLFKILYDELQRQYLYQQENKSKQSEFVLPYMKHQYDNRAITARIREVFRQVGLKTCERAENKKGYVPIISFHSLRYTFITMCSNNHMPQKMVQKLVAHASDKMTSKYYSEDLSETFKYIGYMPDYENNIEEQRKQIFVKESVYKKLEKAKEDGNYNSIDDLLECMLGLGVPIEIN